MKTVDHPDGENNPQWVRPLAVAVQNALNMYLSTDPEGAAELENLSGTTVQISCEQPTFSLYLTPTQNRVEVDWACSEKPQATVSAALGDWLHLGLSYGRGHPAARLNITGNITAAQSFLKVLTNVAFDWEAVAARYTGDIAAHHLGRAARRLRNWQVGAHKVFAENLSEYLQEEAHLTPSRYELEGFLDEVDEAKNKVERLSRRFESALNNKGK